MKTILIIEDDVVLRENTAEFLREEGFQVIIAEDGLAGMQAAMKHIPDLIICDITMPNMNGYDFYKTIQQIDSTSTIPFIFLTALNEKEDIRAGMQLGADDYITKPFDYNDLLRAVNTRLGKLEKILRKNDEKFYALIDNPVIGVYIYQSDKFVYYNEPLAALFGFDLEEFKYVSFEDILTENSREEVMSKIDKCLKDIQSSVLIEFEAIHKTKSIVNIQLFGTFILYNGAKSLIGNMVEIGKGKKIISPNDIVADNSDNLSNREIDVLELLCKGYPSQEIADKLFVSQRTVDSHRANLLAKSGCKNTAELVMYAIRKKYIPLELP
jgi:PAS domain S-box-containing protein